MKIIAGLGNPGAKYETTRHNVGFLALDRLVDSLKATGPITKNQAEVYQAKVAGEPVLLIKPQTFMNLSGRSVGPLFGFYKCEPQDLIVIHDDLDLAPGSLKLKTGGGSGGHNGLRSIDECLGAGKTGYHRVRIGIGQAFLPSGKRMPAETYVLQPFTDGELGELDALLDKVAQASVLLVRGETTQAMNEFNRNSEK